MKRLLFSFIRGALLAWFCLFLATAHAQTCPFDDGNSSLTVEGVILTRYALGITGAPLVANTGIAAADAATVEGAINCPSCGLNITGNATMTVADATIISRKLAGFSGAELTNGLALGSGTRNTPAAVQSFLLAGCGATGGTVTSVATGAGLTGGPITTAGTLSIGSSFRLPQTCTNNQFTRYNAGTLSWDCVTPVAVVNVATGAGLTGGPITTTGTITADTTYLQRRVVNTCVIGSAIRSVAADGSVTCETVPNAGNVWLQGGNAVAAPGVLGTTNAQSLSLISGANANIDIGSGNGLRLDRASNFAYPDVIDITNGSTANSASFYGSTVSGGGSSSTAACAPNATCGNLATGPFATVAGGRANLAGANGFTVGTASTVSGGENNTASGTASTVVGGSRNQATASYSTAIGRNAIARNWGQVAHAGGGFGTAPDFTPGTSQYSRMVLSQSTTTAPGIKVELTPNGTSGTSVTENRLRFRANQSALIDATVLAKQELVAETSAWSIKCIVKVDAAGAATFVPSPCLPTVIAQTGGAGTLTWGVEVDAVTTVTLDGIVRLRVNGSNTPIANLIRWVATVHLTELIE